MVLLSIVGVIAFFYIDIINNGSEEQTLFTLPHRTGGNQNPNGTNPGNPQNPTDVSGTGDTDDWKYSASRTEESMNQSSGTVAPTATMGGIGSALGGMFGGTSTKSAVNSMPSASMAMNDNAIGLSVGGAKDVNNFRENIKSGYLPLLTDITYEGLYYDYYFDTGKSQECAKLFCPSYSRAISADPFSGADEYYLTVGLNSGIKESDFSRKKLAGRDLRGARLAGAKLESTDFSKANLVGADLRGSNAKWANFTGANLAGADLRNADLFHATFDDGDLSGANLGGANLFGSNLINARAPRADFSGAYLKDILMEGIDLSGGSIRDCYAFRGVFSGARLIGTDLSGADLTGAAMEQVDFTNAKLKGTRLAGATLRQAIFFRADMQDAELANADIWNASFDKALNLTDSAQAALVESFVRDRR